MDLKNISQLLNSLPEKIKRVLFSTETFELLEDIAVQEKLTEEQFLLLSDKTSYVLLGIDDVDNFNLSLDPLGLDEATKKKIVTKIQDEVFKPLLELLKNKRVLHVSPKIKDDWNVAKTIREKIKNKDRIGLPEQVKNLPQTNRDVVFDGVWQERTGEIAKKYSLNETQTDSLINNVLYVLIDLIKPDNFLETIITDLGISRLLAEQIMEDLEIRVFEYAFKTIQNQDKKGGSSEKTVEDDLPEIRPEITPMIEPEEKVRVRPVPVGFSGATPKPVSIPQSSTPVPRESTPELVQRPISVPRYTGVAMEEEKRSSQEPVASGKEDTGQVKTPEPVPEPVKRYTVDPYREPIE